MQNRRTFIFVLSLLLSTLAVAAPGPYDESADAKALLTQTLASAKADRLPVLVIFGANWCADCRALDKALKSERNAQQIEHAFKVIKIDVGNFDHNLDIDRAYGDPIKQGIPAAIVLSPNNEVLYATRRGELANARRMSDTGVYDFFEDVLRRTRGH